MENDIFEEEKRANEINDSKLLQSTRTMEIMHAIRIGERTHRESEVETEKEEKKPTANNYIKK